jgi:hypothetical protein
MSSAKNMHKLVIVKVVNARGSQTGAALVVALILLVALSLMAIASMNTASLDLIMAGNEQYGSRAFVAAETGIQNAFLTNSLFVSTADYSLPSAASTGIGNDSYIYTITRPTAGNPSGAPNGYSMKGVSTIPYLITSTGKSERGTVSKNVQAVLQIAPADPAGVTPDTSLPTDLGS